MISKREWQLLQGPVQATGARVHFDTENLRRLTSVLQNATDLFNQQCWCWGRDIVRPEGNWLLEVGFERIPPPPERTDCSSSVYQLLLSGGRRVVLRGFGTFFGNPDFGGVFLSRNKFVPGYSSRPVLDRPPWSDTDLPEMEHLSQMNVDRCLGLTSEFFLWIHEYEANVLRHLGLEYRQATLSSWPRGKRTLVGAEDFAASWQRLSTQLSPASVSH
ncbi:hypothetical protein C5Y96_17215 [Blastopirellula marina]|uniref:Uncharacterized protein n=1 Tax=Blastopirellula marina TaxID=124 RepID=A0A2S8F5S3_9BACT|nr:hypothetical protein C5Y96_17215 [Blastopirellula marina]RCS47821.1 hypothetical protein DTL36_17240 [Bremerella cremea]